MNRLTTVQIKNTKPAAKPVRLADGGGLYLEISPAGGKLWRFKYRYLGKEKRLALGQWPAVSLAEARALRDAARRTLNAGEDPSAAKRAARQAATGEPEHSFNALAQAWLEKQRPRWAASTHAKAEARLRINVLPWLGGRPVADVTTTEIVAVLERVEKRGVPDMARRCAQDIRRTFRLAVAKGLCAANPAADVAAALQVRTGSHFAAATDPRQLAAVLRACSAYRGGLIVRTALQLAPLLACRPGELRSMEWRELDLEAALWRIPGEKMKTRQPHLVPLARQSIALLTDLKPLTGRGRYVFPNGRDTHRPMSGAAVNAALRRLGIDTRTQHTGHGFRAAFRTIGHEQLGIAADVLERQLAHRPAGPLGMAYDRAQLLPQRAEAMQQWADYLQALTEGAEIIPLRGRAA
jgi:integrase